MDIYFSESAIYGARKEKLRNTLPRYNEIRAGVEPADSGFADRSVSHFATGSNSGNFTPFSFKYKVPRLKLLRDYGSNRLAG